MLDPDARGLVKTFRGATQLANVGRHPVAAEEAHASNFTAWPRSPRPWTTEHQLPLGAADSAATGRPANRVLIGGQPGRVNSGHRAEAVRRIAAHPYRRQH